MSKPWRLVKGTPDCVAVYIKWLIERGHDLVGENTECRYRLGFDPEPKDDSSISIYGKKRRMSNADEIVRSDYEAIRSLSTHKEMTNVWLLANKLCLTDSDLVSLFESAWTANISYDHWRRTDSGNKRNLQVKALASEIEGNASKLIENLEQLENIWPRDIRDPDNNIANTHELLARLRELKSSSAIAKKSKGHLVPLPAGFIISALSSQKPNAKKDYIRGFLHLLRESGFPLDKVGVPALLSEVANVVKHGVNDGFLSKDFMRLIPDFRDKK